MSSLDAFLQTIIESLESTTASVERIESGLSEELPSIIQELLSKNGIDADDKLEGVSLLSLKNSSMLSYLNSLAMIILSHLERLKTNDTEELEKSRAKSVENTIVQRVTLERGVKSLEKRLVYQLDKMVRAYTRMEKEETDAKTHAEKTGDDDSDESDSEDDALQFKPDALALTASMKPEPKNSRNRRNRNASEEGDDKESTEKYKPPKIAAVVPPSSVTDIDKASSSSKRNKKLQSMEEYLLETGDAPLAEASIGSTIVQNGRGGVKTARDKAKEQEIQTYEETNFTRLPSTMTKKTSKQKLKDLKHTFGGEDWSIFNSNREVGEETSRKKKPTNAWDRAKRRRTD
ncbi:hypothetical protein BABINDRAFT_162134 [Babjeviella inositovora NRRL Y-12698]|uniref:Uncharacterized protein n=1 Tax=Babjeviella inositovora NRRL Y-12698 TaxID=984486 RepID=A0A1E3QPR1_9ASCO|nr:uncharacterized protein BABINDRAFT_162134 [Babjeviella inositovora NRRL Y-12698]ODQ79062.1 hypothetical protein BABINDRAFT_162134 [Babjeviella inositovora NRRL Y-12698]